MDDVKETRTDCGLIVGASRASLGLEKWRRYLTDDRRLGVHAASTGSRNTRLSSSHRFIHDSATRDQYGRPSQAHAGVGT